MKRDICFVTFARNEPVRLPVWIKHYKQFCSNEDMYVIDQNTTDGSTDNLECCVKREPNDAVFDHTWLRQMLTNNLCILLQYYEVVVMTECDELMFTKNNENLKDYLVETYKGKNINGATSLYDMLQHDSEKDYDSNMKISQQRNYWFDWGVYKHTIFTYCDREVENGFHNGNGIYNDNLVTLHIQMLNKQWFVDKIINRIAEKNKYGQGDNHGCWDVHYNEDLIQKNLDFYYKSNQMVKTPEYFNTNVYI